MEFNEKVQELRKSKGLTQEELAESLFVSRTAVSKWESGKGYPNIDSLKAIAKLFSVTLDELLSSDQMLTIAEEDSKKNMAHIRDLVFGLLDLSVVLLFFLPLFGQTSDGIIQEVSLLSLIGISTYLKLAYLVLVIATVALGVLTLALQNCSNGVWVRSKGNLSLILNGTTMLLFIISMQPYAAVLLFLFLAIKTIMLVKWH